VNRHWRYFHRRRHRHCCLRYLFASHLLAHPLGLLTSPVLRRGLRCHLLRIRCLAVAGYSRVPLAIQVLREVMAVQEAMVSPEVKVSPVAKAAQAGTVTPGAATTRVGQKARAVLASLMTGLKDFVATAYLVWASSGVAE
jgi:hypothetical protein